MAQIRLRYVHEFRDDHGSGKLRYYFRRKGAKQIPLPGLPFSTEFMAAYHWWRNTVTAAGVWM